MTQTRWEYLLNRKARCEKRGKLHEQNREKAKERKSANKKKLLLAGHSRYEPKKEF